MYPYKITSDQARAPSDEALNKSPQTQLGAPSDETRGKSPQTKLGLPHTKLRAPQTTLGSVI